MKFFKKTLCLILVVSIILPSLLFSPKKVSAFTLPPGLVPIPADKLPPVPTSDASIRQKEVGITIFGITIPGITLDSFMIIFAKILLSRMADATVDWINRGFDGSPVYATDPQAFFLQTADNVAGEFLNSAGWGALCSPFRLEVNTALRNIYSSSRITSRTPFQARCPLSQVVNNIDAFLNGDFSQGGWDAWFAMTQNAYGNPFDATLNAQAQLSLRINNEKTIELAKLNWAGGFLSWSDCIEREGNDDSGGPDGDPATSDGECTKRGPTKTPGKVIETQLENVLGSEVKQLELADEFDEMVSALVGQLVKKIFTSAGGLFSGGGSNRYSDGGRQQDTGGSCSANRDTAVIGDEITWTVSVFGTDPENSTIQWSGDEGLSGNTNQVKKVYTIPGVKSASVVITDPAGRTSTVTCTDTVEVSRYPALAGSCRPNSYSAGAFIITSSGDPVTWYGTFTGGSGVLDQAIFSDQFEGDSEGAAIVPPSSPPPGITFNPPVGGGVRGVYATFQYNRIGDHNVTLRLIDTDPTVRPATIQCTDSVTVFLKP